MFAVSQGILQSNLFAPMSSIISHSVRNSRTCSLTEPKNSSKIQDPNRTNSPIFEEKTVKLTLEQLGVSNEREFEKLLKSKALKSIHIYGNNCKDFNFKLRKKGIQNELQTSYVSGNSFAENQLLCDFSQNTQRLLSTNSFLSRTNILNGTVRGFKTKRSFDREAVESPSVTSWLKENIQSPSKSSTKAMDKSAKLKALLEEEPSPETKKGIKVAFAEGYLAANRRKVEPKHVNWIVLLLLFGVGTAIYFFRMMNPIYINEVVPEEVNVTFDDVRGVEEAKLELQEVVEFLRNPAKFTSLGAELPKGVLLVGPPGTGKTLLARAVAGEAAVPFFHAAGPEFDEVLVGQGARRVRDLFRAAQMRAPCVIFIDEIDSVGAKRTNSVLHPYANQTINQLLSEMDGFHKNKGVIVLGATNRRDDLDKALLRPGRFDVEIQVPSPDLAGRRQILDYYLGKVKTGPDVDSLVLARGTTGFTGADIKNVVNQAALRAAIDEVDMVSLKHLESARDKILMGPEKKSRIPDEESNWITAYHEGGHTLVSYFTKDALPIHKVTIIPRGASLGHTAYIPSKEQYHMTRSQMLAQLDSLMGGRAAEELIYGNERITSGASSDLKQATSIATHMVKDLGMSDKVGLRTFDERSEALIVASDSLSVSTKEMIDSEIKRLLSESYERAKQILKDHSKEHKALAEALMRYETLDAEDIKAILNGKKFSSKEPQ